jgi:hypothetical protein
MEVELNYRTSDFGEAMQAAAKANAQQQPAGGGGGGGDLFKPVLEAMSSERRAALEALESPRERFGMLLKEMQARPELMAGLEKQLEQRDRFAERFTQKETMVVRDGRALGAAGGDGLFATGFTLLRHEASVRDWNDGEEVREIYYPEICELVKAQTGATHAFCANHLRRNSDLGDVVSKLFGVATAPIQSVHNDFTAVYGEEVLRSFESGGGGAGFGNVEEMKAAGVTPELMRSSRLLMVNTWRSVSPEPLARNPLAVCDVRTVGLEELVANRLGGNADSLEVYGSMFNPDHEWYSYAGMNQDEVLLIKTFDSEMQPFVPTLHTSFEIPDTAEDAPARRSCEARVLCLLPKESAAKL